MVPFWSAAPGTIDDCPNQYTDYRGRYASAIGTNLGFVLTTSARLFRLLSQLLLPGTHSGPALAERLGVSSRTLRSDVATLRDLGYPVQAVSGAGGGYRLGAGSRLPPLLLDDDETVAVALGLALSATHSISDTSDAAMRALSKIIAMLPARLRPRLATLASATGGAGMGATAISSESLQTIAATVQSRERLRFEYRAADRTESHREVEPYRIVLRAGRWYLVGWDADRDDWRTFRIDRMRIKTPNGRRFSGRAEPTGGFEAFLTRSIETAAWQNIYRVRLEAPAVAIRRRAPISVQVEPDGDHACIVTVGSDNAAAVARYLSWWEVPFAVLDSPPELLDEVRLLAKRYCSAAEASLAIETTGPDPRIKPASSGASRP